MAAYFKEALSLKQLWLICEDGAQMVVMLQNWGLIPKVRRCPDCNGTLHLTKQAQRYSRILESRIQIAFKRIQKRSSSNLLRRKILVRTRVNELEYYLNAS